MSSNPSSRRHFTAVCSPSRCDDSHDSDSNPSAAAASEFNNLFGQVGDSDSDSWHSNDDDLIYEGDSGDDCLVSDFYGDMEMARPAKTRKKNPGAEPIAKQSSASSQWTTEVVEGPSGYIQVKNKDNPLISVTVRSNRVNKAKEKLDPRNIHNILASGSACNCHNRCNENTVAFKDILNLRKLLFGDPNLKTEAMVTDKVVAILSSLNPSAASNPEATLKYSIPDSHKHSHKVCSRFWAAAYGCCESKMRLVRTMVKQGSTKYVHGRKYKLSGLKQKPKYDYAYSFWTTFFENCCQKPTDHIRLFPVNKPYQTIYDMYFVPWYKKNVRKRSPNDDVAVDELEWIPSFSVFKKARRHEDFLDVKKRPKHYHARCADCAELNNIRLRGFVNDLHEDQWKLRFNYLLLRLLL